MRDLIPAPLIISFVAQLPSTPWEQVTISGLGITATVFLWRYFTTKEVEVKKAADAITLAREAEDKAERNRLLEVQNQLQKQVVDLLRQSRVDAQTVARKLEDGPVKTLVVNDEKHPVPNKPID